MHEAAHLSLKGVKHYYGKTQTLLDFSMELAPGKIGCLLGSSGCGKTTLLRCLAGLEPVHGGTIRMDGELVSDASVCLPPEQRNLGFVFQDYALFPHLTVERNLLFPMRHWSRQEAQDRVDYLIETVGLGPFRRRYPSQLSGGQQQRVAIARALALRPKLLLMDEPFSNLDATMSTRVKMEIKELIRGTGVTVLLVTHDQSEAFELADEIGFMHCGKILQWGTPRELYYQPNCPEVAEFLGDGSFIAGNWRASDQGLVTPLGILPKEKLRLAGELLSAARARLSGSSRIHIRPENIRLDATGTIEGRIIACAYRGFYYLVDILLQDGQKVTGIQQGVFDWQKGDSVKVSLCADQLSVFP